MLDNLINLVKEHAGDSIINNPVIPNEKNNEAIETTAGSIVDTLKSQATGGNISNVLDMFKGGANSNSAITNAISGNVVNDLMKKFGIDNAQATSIASGLLPKVIDNFVSKTNNPNDKSFDLQDIVKTIGGGNLSGMLGGLGSLFN